MLFPNKTKKNYQIGARKSWDRKIYPEKYSSLIFKQQQNLGRSVLFCFFKLFMLGFPFFFPLDGLPYAAMIFIQSLSQLRSNHGNDSQFHLRENGSTRGSIGEKKVRCKLTIECLKHVSQGGDHVIILKRRKQC